MEEPSLSEALSANESADDAECYIESEALAPFTSCSLRTHTFENISVLLKAPQIRLEQAKCAFRIRCIHSGSRQTHYPAFLRLHNAPRLDDVFLGTAKVVPMIQDGA